MSAINYDDVLIHHGVKGMKWGVRKDRGPEGVSRKTNRQASKDAKEFTSAKMYFGEGAGTRRKLIKATVTQKSKDPSYKKAFDYHVNKTDMAKRAEQARGKRKRTDVVKGTAKTARGIGHLIRGNGRYASLAAATIFTAAVAAHKSGLDKKIFDAGKSGLKTAMNSQTFQTGADFIKSRL